MRIEKDLQSRQQLLADLRRHAHQAGGDAAMPDTAAIIEEVAC